ncbi:TPA: cytidylyltransferase domain-containing protein [Bacillus cereus]
MKILSIITARGGSKGVPGKNIRSLGGIPLIGHTIQAAKDCALVDKVIVSTDCPQIAQISEKFGAQVPFIRPEELARDETPTLPVLQHAVKYMNEEFGYNPDYVLTLQPTSPFRNSTHLTEAINLLKHQPESVVSVTESKHPSLLKSVQDGMLVPYEKTDKVYNRRQDMPKVYLLNGAIFLTRIDVLMNQNIIISESAKPYYMKVAESVDIDSELDFKLAEFLLKEKNFN